MIIYILPLLFLFFSNSSESINEEYKVLNDLFLECVGTELYFKPVPKPPYKPIHPDSIEELDILTEEEISEYESSIRNKYEAFDWENYRAEKEEYDKLVNTPVLDDRDLILLVGDSLIVFSDYDFLIQLSDSASFVRNFPCEPSWRTLCRELAESDLQSMGINLDNLYDVGKYVLKYDDSQYETKDNERIVGRLWFSRIEFNKAKSRACFYYAMNLGPKNAWGNIVFAEKIDGKWQVSCSRNLWVS